MFTFDHRLQWLLVQNVWTCFQSVRFREISNCHAAYFYTTILEATTTTANPSKGSLMQSMWLCVLQNQSPLLHVLATRGLQEGQPLFCQKNHRRVRAVHITTPPNFEKKVKGISYWHFVIIFWNTLWVQNCLRKLHLICMVSSAINGPWTVRIIYRKVFFVTLSGCCDI